MWPNNSFKPTSLRRFTFAPALRQPKAFALARVGLTRALNATNTLHEYSPSSEDRSAIRKGIRSLLALR